MVECLVFLGPPGAGKGTLAGLLAKEQGWKHLATGDLIREEIKLQTPLGIEIKQIVESGKLVEDSIIIALMRKKIVEPGAKSLILDGYPRTLEQARALDGLLEKEKGGLKHTVYLNVSVEEITKRLSGRRQCEKCKAVYNLSWTPAKIPGICDACGGKLIQRADDKPETVQARYKVYEEQTLPLIAYYRKAGKLLEVPAHGSVEENLVRVKKALGLQ